MSGESINTWSGWGDWFNETSMAVLDGYKEVKVAQAAAEAVPPVPDPDRNPAATSNQAQEGGSDRVVFGNITQGEMILGGVALLAVALVLRG